MERIPLMVMEDQEFILMRRPPVAKQTADRRTKRYPLFCWFMKVKLLCINFHNYSMIISNRQKSVDRKNKVCTI